MSDSKTIDRAETDDGAEPPRHRGAGGGSLLQPAYLVRAVVWILVALLILLPPSLLSDSWLKTGQFVMIGAVAAIGLTLLTGQAGQLSLGSPFFMFIGAVTYCVVASEDVPGKTGLGLPSLVGVLAAIAVTALLGLAFAPVAGRVRGVYLGVATLSLVYVGLYFGQEYTSLSGGTASGRRVPDLNIFGSTFKLNDPEKMWWLFSVFVLISYLLARGAVNSRPGRAWRAIRDNESAASALGVPVKRVRTEVFAISSAFAGLAGVMTAMWYRLLKPDENVFQGSYTIDVAIALLAMVLIGGLGSVGGAIAGAVLVFGMPKALDLWLGGSGFFGNGPHAVTPVIFTAFAYGTAIILVVLFEPSGLAGLGRRAKAALCRTPLGFLFTSPKGS